MPFSVLSAPDQTKSPTNLKRMPDFFYEAAGNARQAAGLRHAP
jgi:hypothetical protein